MGKGDRKTRKGKIFLGTYGNSRRPKKYSVQDLLFKQNKYYRKKFSKTPTFKNTGLNQIVNEVALALTALKGDYFYPSGTAVIIAPHLAITAKHVIEDYINEFEGKKVIKKDFNATFSMQAVQILDKGKKGALWEIQKIFPCPVSDIALLFLIPKNQEAADYKWRISASSVEIPKPGERIVGFGYSDSKITNSNNKVEWVQSPNTSVGEVIEVHAELRDTSRLNFPCFHTNARFDGGMSGGPVFNDDGKLIGIICSNLPPSNYQESHVSYVALLWPSLITKVEIQYDGFNLGNAYPLLSLAQNNICPIEGWEKVILIPGDDEGWYKGISLRK